MRPRFRLSRRASVGAAIASLFGLALVGPTSGTTTASAATGDFTIRQPGSSLCLQPQSNGPNTQIMLAGCTSSSAQQRWWSLTFPTVGMMFGSRAAGGPCLAVHNNLTIVGAPIETEECSQDFNMFWALIATSAPSDGTFIIQNPVSHLCAGLFGSFLGLQNCDLSSSSQRFVLIPA